MLYKKKKFTNTKQLNLASQIHSTSFKKHTAMAELPSIQFDEYIKKIDSKLKCSICGDYLKEPPKILPCFHTFCQSPCLQGRVVHGPNGQSLTCPICQHHVALPDGVAGLKTDFDVKKLSERRRSLDIADKTDCENCKTKRAANYCQHCTKLLCKECTVTHQNWEEFSRHKVWTIMEVRADPKTLDFIDCTPKCEQHNLNTTLYCKSCSKIICTSCKSGAHSSHTVEDIPTIKSKLQSEAKTLEEKQLQVEETIQALHPITNDVNNQKGTIREKIEGKIETLHDLLKTRREELMSTLEDHAQQIKRELDMQTGEVHCTYQAISSCLEYIQRRLEGQEHDLLIMIEPILKRIKEVNEFELGAIQPEATGDIGLDANDDQARKVIEEFRVVTENTVHVTNCYAEGEGTKFAIARTEASLTMHAKTRESKPCVQKLTVTSGLEKTDCEIEDMENGQYKITYVASQRGKDSLYIKINSKHIQGSPYPIAVIPTLKSLRESFRTIKLGCPSCITTDSKKRLLVESSGHISVLTPSGEKIFSFATQGSSSLACGIAVDHEGNIYVADSVSNRIQKFTCNGEFKAAIGSKGSSLLQFDSPIGICFNKTNKRLYICDQFNHRVQAIPTSLTVVRSFQIGEKGEKEGQFQNPNCIALDSENNTYVTDHGNNRVQVFTPDGEFLRAFSDKANGEKLEGPFAIAIDNSNTVYVSEWKRHCVSVFTSQGEYITSFGTKGNKKGQLNEIRGLYVDQSNYIIVSDSGNNRLQMF